MNYKREWREYRKMDNAHMETEQLEIQLKCFHEARPHCPKEKDFHGAGWSNQEVREELWIIRDELRSRNIKPKF